MQLTESDQEPYRNFPLVISERWQTEVAETVFEAINSEADKHELKKKAKHKHKFDTDEKGELSGGHPWERASFIRDAHKCFSLKVR